MRFCQTTISMSYLVSVRTKHSASLMGTTVAYDLHRQICNNGHQSILHRSSNAPRLSRECQMSCAVSFTPKWIGVYREARNRLASKSGNDGRRVSTLRLHVFASRGGIIKTYITLYSLFSL